MDLYRLLLKDMEINVPISTGELIDKITILEIKKNKLKNVEKIQNVKKELNLLNQIYFQILTKNKKSIIWKMDRSRTIGR